MDDKKTDFTFGLFIGFAMLFLLIDLSFVFFLPDSQLHGISLPKTEFITQLYSVFSILHDTILGNYFLNKFVIIAFISIASAVKNVKLKPKEEQNQTPVFNYFIYAFFSAGIFISSKFLIGKIPFGYAVIDILMFFLFGYYAAKITTYYNSGLLKDRFGLEGRKFKQLDKLIENEYSVNIKTADGWINIVNPFRAVMVLGTPGSGKSYAVLLEAIEQHIKKGFSLFLYDFKFDDLTKFAYNCFIRYKKNYKTEPEFCIINFDDPSRTHRSNPLQPDLMFDFSDAVESAKSVLFGLNKSWIDKEGEFFVEGPINFLAICIWALKLEQGGKYCSLPHVIELISKEYSQLFGFLKKFIDDTSIQNVTDASIQNVLAAFSSALENEAYDQLEGQVASVRNGLTRLTSPVIYYVMTTGEEEFENVSLDFNNPDKPKILCIGNNPKRQQVYSACISLYNSTVTRLANSKDRLKSAFIYDELPTLSMPKGTLDNLIATGRSNKVAVWLGFQDKQQLNRDFGEKNSKAVFNTIGNIITGMVTGDTSQNLSKMFGKIKVMKKSHSVNKGVITENFSEEMQDAISASRLSTLPTGWFAGQVADSFDQQIEQKFFHSQIIVDKQHRDKLDTYEIPLIFDFNKLGLTQENVLMAVFKKVRNDIKNLLAEFTD